MWWVWWWGLFRGVCGQVDPRLGLVTGLTVGLTYGLISSTTWSTTLAWQLQLQRSRHVPAVRLLPFLEDARKRGVLRTVGAIYQFRHAT